VPQVEQRRILPADSDAAHRLLVEQALQVIDLVADASGLDVLGPGKTYLASVRELKALPHLTAQIAALGLPANSGAERGDLVAAEAALARTLGHLNEGLKRSGVADPVLASALATAGVSADRLFQLRRHGDPADAAALSSAAAAALQAQAHLFDAASHAVRQALRVRVDRVETQRARLLALMAGLALLAAGLAYAVLRHLAPHPTGPGGAGATFEDESDGQALHRDVSGRLWQRLRQDGLGEAPSAKPAAAPSNASQKDNT